MYLWHYVLTCFCSATGKVSKAKCLVQDAVVLAQNRSLIHHVGSSSYGKCIHTPYLLTILKDKCVYMSVFCKLSSGVFWFRKGERKIQTKLLFKSSNEHPHPFYIGVPFLGGWGKEYLCCFELALPEYFPKYYNYESQNQRLP